MTRSTAGSVAVLLGLALLVGCGTSPAHIVASPVSASRPTGSYTWHSDVHDVVPAGSVKVLTGESGIWTFHDGGCTTTRCTGTITTSHGHRWGYAWDGSRFHITRAPLPLRQGCADSGEQAKGGYAMTLRTYRPTTTSQVVPATGSKGGPPQRITFDVRQRSTIVKLVGCTAPRTTWQSLTVHFEFVHGG